MTLPARPAAGASVKSENRFTRERRCPICGGQEGNRRGQGERCFGFLSEDGQWAHCTRPEHAGLSPLNASTQAYQHRLKGPCPCGKEHSAADEIIYQYRGPSGALLFEVVRYPPKRFLQRRPAPGGGYEWNLDGVERVPYRLPELSAADPGELVVIAEGEKDCGNLVAKGFVATCNAGGAGKWRPEFSDHLAGRHVAILGDNDKPGRDHAEQVAKSLIGKAASIKVLELPDLPEEGDVSDWLQRGGTAEGLRAIIEAAPLWSPSPSGADTAAETEAPRKKSGDGTAAKTAKAGPTHAEMILKFAAPAKLFHSPAGRAYACVPIGAHHETLPVRSSALRLWLIRLFHERKKRPPASDGLQAALGVLEARALFDGPEEPVFVRVAPGPDGSLFIDLGDATCRAIHVRPGSWEIAGQPSVRFYRPAGMRALPTPERGGTLEGLKPFINVRGEDFPLVAAWMTQSLRPDGPYPILGVSGESGSAKTTSVSVLRKLTDPNASPLRSPPKDERDLMISATKNRVVAFDNLSSIPNWLSDGLCRVSTGGGFATRQLYTDDDEVFLDAKRPILITAIGDVLRRDDLANRAVFLALEPIPDDKRQTEAEFWAKFDAVYPELFSALLDALAGGLKKRPEIKLSEKPRMADFALWGEAVCQATGGKPKAFLEAYRGNRQAAAEALIEDSPVAVILRSFMTDKVEQEKTPGEWFDALTDKLGNPDPLPKRWPKSPRGLTGALKRLAPSLRAVGLSVSFGRANKPWIRVAPLKVGKEPTQPTQPTQSLEIKAEDRVGSCVGSKEQPTQPTQTDAQPTQTEPSTAQDVASKSVGRVGCVGQIPTLGGTVVDDGPECGGCLRLDCPSCNPDFRP
jgi:hypothetical protein